MLDILRNLTSGIKVIQLNGKIRKCDGMPFQVKLPELKDFSDTIQNPTRSNLLLFENEIPLGPSHSLHDEIRNYGKGRYSHWEDSIIFSARDNSDPIDNGHNYTALVFLEKRNFNPVWATILLNCFQHGMTEEARKESVHWAMKKTFDEEHFFNDPLGQMKEEALSLLIEQLSLLYGGSVAGLQKYRLFRDLILKHLGKLDGLVVCEMGPGRHAGLGLLMLMAGIRKYFCIEAFQDPHWNDGVCLKSMLKLAKYFYPELDQDKVVEVLDADISSEQTFHFKEDFIKAYWLEPDSEKLPLDSGLIDVVLSVAVMEHVKNPDMLIKETARVLRRGGISVNLVDVAEHKPLSKNDDCNFVEFLKYSKEEWEWKWNKSNMQFYTNRWRRLDFVEAFQRNGFKIVDNIVDEDLLSMITNADLLKRKLSKRQRVSEEIRHSFHSNFHHFSLRELEVLNCLIVAEKYT